jgi:hypothetical protein
MSELVEPRWAVISERGCEASGLNHEDALKLMRHLTQEKIYGLCIVTETAARRFTVNNNQSTSQTRTRTRYLRNS